VTRPIRLHLASLSEYHIFSPSVTNELRLGYNRKSDNIVVPNFSYPGLDAFPNITIDELGTLDIGPHDEAPQYTIFNTYQLVDNVTWTHGAHTFKFGFDGRKLISPQQFTQRSRGDYHYSSLDLFLRDISPDVQAERSLGAPTYYGDQIATYAFAQDTWKIRPNVSLDLGVRYEYTSVPYGEKSQALNAAANLPGVLDFREPKAQTTNFAPRLGIAWSPGTSGNTSIRAGFGMAYDVLFDNIGILALPPEFSTTVDTDVSNPQPNYLKNGGIPANFQGGSTALDTATARSLTSNYIPDQKVPMSIQWNFGVQHVFRRDYTLEVRYLGSRGVHLVTQNQFNRISRVSATRNLPTFLQQPSTSTLAALPLTLGDLTATSNNWLAPYGFPNTITTYMARGNSTYNGLAVQLNRRFSRGLQMVGSYTWSHLISDSDAEFNSTVLSPRRPVDFQNWRQERGNSAFDRRQRFTLSTIWETPWLKSNHNWFLHNIVGNYLLTGTYTAESPEYATVQSNFDANLNGDTVDRAILNGGGVTGTGSGVTPVNRLGQPVAFNSAATVAYVALNPNAQYILAGPGSYSTLGRNTLPTRGINNFDVSVVKRFNVTENKRFELSAAAFNLFNHAQFVPGAINNVYPQDTHSQTGRNFLIPGTKIFNDFSQAYSNNPRNIVLNARFVF
jgi:outer membrane receptor protein involved in Fe transport